jgi:hypothetical protein
VSTFRLGSSLPRIDVTVRAGQALALAVPVLGADGVAVDTAQLSSARAQVREGPGGGALLFEFSTTDGGAAIGDDGMVTLTATAEQTAEWAGSWPPAGAWWDLEATDSGGQPHQLTAPSRLYVLGRITR